MKSLAVIHGMSSHCSRRAVSVPIPPRSSPSSPSSWSNITGDHELTFGIGENRFGPFPDPGEGYADEIGSVYVPGHSYRCAASGAWTSSFQFHLKVQVIDKYFGTMDVVFGFSEREDGTPAIGIHFSKDAEDFLWGYEGVAGGRPADTSRHAYI